MKRWLLTLPFLLAGMAGLVRADYFLIVINTSNGTGAPDPARPPMPMGMPMGMPQPVTSSADLVSVIVESENQKPYDTFVKKQFEEKFIPQTVRFHNHSIKVSHLSSLSWVTLHAEASDSNPKDVRVRPNVH